MPSPRGTLRAEVKLPGPARGALNSIPGVQLGPPEGQLPSASPTESMRFTLQVMAPNVAQGLFRRRPRAVAVAARLGTDGQAIGVVEGIRRAHGEGPVWVRVGRGRMLLVLAREDVRRVLEGSPESFAADPEAKRKGMAHFQPDALTISRGAEWRARRDFAEDVLDTGRPAHRHAARFAGVCRDETARLVAGSNGEIDWDSFNAAFWRITRRIILGDSARDDTALTEALWELMDQANGLPDDASPELPPFLRRIASYVDAADETGLVGLFAPAAASDEVRVERQLTHWLFALGDTAAANAFRALALLSAHPGSDELYLRACLQEAMRLWPTTPVLSRETTVETEWNGVWVPKGTQILISNTFNHRDPLREDADSFAPDNWLNGGRAAEDWSLNHFSHGPQECPGAGIALQIAATVLDELTRGGTPEAVGTPLVTDEPMPRTLDFFPLRFTLP